MSKNRTRKNDVRLLFDDEEINKIEEGMKRVGIQNRSAYLRKLALDGYMILIDTAPLAELSRLVRNAAGNINQVAKRANETGSVYENDVLDLLKEFNRLKPLIVEAHKIAVNLDNK